MIEPRPADAAFPQTFGPYVLERFIAAGGMAEVFLATCDSFDTPICVKRMLPEMMKNPEYVTMFRDEAALSMRLEHPNIVRVLDCGEIDGRMYMAMEYVEGMDVGSLQRRLRQRQEQLGVAHALQIGVDLCAGLHHAHALTDERRRPLKLIHRDVSPQNILISSMGEVKVTDFGIAKAIGRETHTQTGLIKGKIAYMAPEQALGQYIDQRLDQFAAGIVVWEMLTGQRLYHAPSELLTFEKIIRQPPPRPSSARSGIPTFVDNVVVRALAKAPDERYPDVGAFGAALAQALAQVGGTAELGPVIRWVLTGAGPPPSALPAGDVLRAPGTSPSRPAQSSPRAVTQQGRRGLAVTPGPSAAAAAAAAAEQAPTVLTPKSSPRLPTSAMTPLPLPDTGSRTPRTSSSALRSSSGLELDRTQQLADAVLPPFAPPGIESSQPLNGLSREASSPSRVAAPLPAPSRGVPVVLVAVALVVGAAAGFGAARVTAKAPRSQADCAAPSTSMDAVQASAEAMKRAEMALRTGDLPAASRAAREANAVHGTAAAHMLLGQSALKGGNRVEALTHFRCVAALDPSGPAAASLERLLSGP